MWIRLFFWLIGGALAAPPGSLATQPEPLALGSGFYNGDSYFYEYAGNIYFGHLMLNNSKYAPPEVSTNHGVQQYNEIAGIRHDRCGVNSRGEKICVGERVRRGNERGMVLGVFANGDAVYSASSKKLQRVPAQELKIFTLNELTSREIRAAIEGLTDINQIIDVAKKFGCGEEELRSKLSEEPSSLKSKTCEEPPSPATGEDSPNLAQFETLLARGMEAPLEDFLTLWYPERGEKNLDSPLFACEKYESGPLVPGVKDCAPESLYSWGPPMKTTALKQNMTDGEEWSSYVNSGVGGGRIFATISPASTFGYGSTLVRLKPKSDDVFSKHYDHQKISVRQDIFHDLVVAHQSSIESWSYGTPEIYDELVRDILRYQSGKRVSTYSELDRENTSVSMKYFGIDRLFAQNPDVHRHDETQLKMNLLELIRQILMEEGRIHYAKGTCRNRALHYSAKRPSYFNPIRRK